MPGCGLVLESSGGGESVGWRVVEGRPGHSLLVAGGKGEEGSGMTQGGGVQLEPGMSMVP